MASPENERISLQLLDPEVKGRLRTVFDELEGKLSIDGLGVALYTVVMELVGNAVKANLKRAYFRKHGYDLDDESSYLDGVKAFKGDYEKVQREDYVRAMEELELKVTVEVDLDHERLLTYVENNSLLTEEEEQRIRAKLSTAMDSVELSEFYMNYGDEMEGSGLGLAMIVFLIREIGFNPSNFRVFHRGAKTIARLEFPLNADYVPIRERDTPVFGL